MVCVGVIKKESTQYTSAFFCLYVSYSSTNEANLFLINSPILLK